MPIDSQGNRADIVLDPASTISRMNIGRLYEHYMSGAARDVRQQIRAMLGITGMSSSVDNIGSLDRKQVTAAYEYLLAFYKLVCTRQFEFFKRLGEEGVLEHLSECTKDKINALQLYIPIDNDINSVDMVRNVEALVKPTYGPVSYVGNSGRRSTTKANVRIAPMYFMLLDKITDEWSSVATGRLQHFGILSPNIKSEKFIFPFRNTPIRAYGEAELRILQLISQRYVAELIDRNNNPQTQRAMAVAILTADKPTRIPVLVDRRIHPFGNSKNIQVVKHPITTSGIRICYSKED